MSEQRTYVKSPCVLCILLLASCLEEGRSAPPPPAEPGAPTSAPAGWRGARAGHYPKAAPPREWSDGRNILWKADAGEGRSSPLVVGDRIFLTAEPDRLLCFRADDGTVLWRRTNGAKDLPAGSRRKDLQPPTECGYATCTPCTDGAHVYALFGNGVAACYDLEGRRRWIRRIDIRQTEEHGRSASPVLVGGRLLVHVTDLFCLDARTGRTLWQQPAEPAFGTPCCVRVGGTDVVITPKGDVFSVGDGKKLAARIAALEVASPVAHEGVVYFIGSVAKALKLPPQVKGHKLHPVSELWKVQLPGMFYASCVIHDGRAYAVNRQGHFFALDAKSGRTLFSKKLQVKSECAPSLNVAGGRLFLWTDDGAAFVLQPGGAYRLVGTGVLAGGSVATPTFCGDRIFLRSGRVLVCLKGGARLASVAAASRPARPTPQEPRPKQPGREPPGPIKPPHAPARTPTLLMGWRGNATGLFPRADPPVTWGRKSKGIAAGLRISAARPRGAGPGQATPLRDHYPRQWLVTGPFPAPAGLDEPALANEAEVQPDEGDRAGRLAWKRCAVPQEIMPPADRGTVAAAVPLRFVEPGKALGGFQANHLVYAHTYLHAERAGEVEIVVDHAAGLRIWVNGREVYKKPSTEVRLSWYTVLSRFRTLEYVIDPSPRVPVRLNKGWNRLLFKLAHGRRNHNSYNFHPRIVDPPDAPCQTANILWAAPLPDRSNATPVLAGDRIFVMAEPDQILCLDKKTGKQLWTRFLGRYQATPKTERDANPAFGKKVEPLVARLPQARGLAERFNLRRQIDAALVAIDPQKYKLDWDGHMASHFRIVGWTQPTPCSDGRYVYVYCGNGVAACYDLAGNTRWIRRVNPQQMHYPASPALMDGKFIVFAGGGFNLVALDAATGRVAWRQPKVDRSIGALLGARIHGVSVVLTQQGDVVRAADGHVLYANPLKTKGDTGWAPPLCLGSVVYLPWYGVGGLMVMDFTGAAGDAWTCKLRRLGGIAISRDKQGRWVDRWTCGSPLVHDGIYYNHDVFGTLYAVDVKTGKVLYRQDLSAELNSLSHYNAVGVAASITLGGRHLFVLDNQGTTVVFEPGPAFRKVAVNRIQRQVYRPWPIRPQEEIGYSPPLFEGPRMYLRGEYYLYCIGRE